MASEKTAQTAAFSFVNFIYKKLVGGLFVAGFFFDLSSVFEVLSSEFIESKLYNVGFRGIFLEWVTSFITNRNMTVRVGAASSPTCKINLGVSQVSVLGPLLFFFVYKRSTGLY